MRTLLAVALVLTLGACFKVVDIPFATDPRILRGAWSGQMDAACDVFAFNAQVNADNSRLVSSGARAAIWNFATGAKIASLERSVGEGIGLVHWTNSGEVIGSVGNGDSLFIRRWRGDDGRTIASFQLPATYNFYSSRDGSRYVLDNYDASLKQRKLQVFDAVGTPISSVVIGNNESVLNVSDDGSLLVTFERIGTDNTTTGQYSLADTLRIRASVDGELLHSIDVSQLSIDYFNWVVSGQVIWGYSNTKNQLARIDSSGTLTTRAFNAKQGAAYSAMRFSVSSDQQRVAVKTAEEVRVYDLTDLSSSIKTITTKDLSGLNGGSSINWSGDGQRLVLGFAEPRNSVPNFRDVRLSYAGYSGLRCGLTSVPVSTGLPVEFIESERERIAVAMQLEANYVSDRQYAISGTATIGAVQYTVTGEGSAERDERLFAAPPAVDGHQITLALRDTTGNAVWKTGNRPIALPKRDFDISPLNALGLLERVSDGKQFLIDLERR